MLDDFQEGIGQANLLNGFDLNATDPAELAQTKATLEHQKEYLRGYSTNAAPQLLSGAAWIHHAWNGDIINTRNQAKQGPGDLQVRDLQGGHPGRLGLHGDPGQRQVARAPRCCSSTGSSTRTTRRRTSSTIGYPMPIEGSEDAFAELAKPTIRRSRSPTDDLESGSQFKELSRRGAQGLGPRLDGGQGVTDAFWRRFLVPGALWLAFFFAVPFGIAIAISLGQAARVRRRASTAGNPGNYADALDPLFAPVLLRSVGYAAATARALPR